MIIKAVQFLRPNGRQIDGEVEVDDALASQVDLAEKFGLRVELEVLTTGEIHATLSNNLGDYVDSIFKNTPSNKDKISDMFRKITKENLDMITESLANYP